MTISDFKQKTEKLFNPINGMTQTDIENVVRDLVASEIDDLPISDIIMAGSRCRGKESSGSDLDVILYYNGDMREDHLFNILHAEQRDIYGVNIDINPISAELTDIEYYLDSVEEYLNADKETQK